MHPILGIRATLLCVLSVKVFDAFRNLFCPSRTHARSLNGNADEVEVLTDLRRVPRKQLQVPQEVFDRVGLDLVVYDLRNSRRRNVKKLRELDGFHFLLIDVLNEVAAQRDLQPVIDREVGLVCDVRELRLVFLGPFDPF